MRQKIYNVGGDPPAHCMSRLCLRPSVRVVLSVKAEWLSGPKCPDVQPDRDRCGRGALESLCLVLNRGSLCSTLLKPYCSIICAVFCTVFTFLFWTQSLSTPSIVTVIHQKKCLIHDQRPHDEYYYYRPMQSNTKIMIKHVQQNFSLSCSYAHFILILKRTSA